LAGDIELSGPARAVYEYLREEGASLAVEIERAVQLPGSAVRGALVELALAQLATSDSGDGMRAVLESESPASMGRGTVSALEADLSARRTRPAMIARPRDHRHRGLARRDLRRLELERNPAESSAPTDPWSGRWGLLHRTGVLGPPRSDEELAFQRAQALLRRYGVLTREAMDREEGPFDWPPLAAQLARLEMRGEVRRGYFVAGLWGVQYALPAAVELLRSATAPDHDAPLVVLNACDPAQLHGSVTTAPVALVDAPDAGPSNDAAEIPRFARLPSTHVVLQNGRVLLVAEDNGERMWTPGDLSPENAYRAVAAYVARPCAARRVVLRTWNGAPALGSAAQEILRPLGFTRTPNGLERWE
jgi:ATP-dependent Lhr-like helicase